MPGAGTDKTKEWVERPGPCVILVEPQLADNVGSVARAMANFGADAAAARQAAHGVAGRARLRDGRRARIASSNRRSSSTSVEAAIGDLTYVFATTARAHDQAKPVSDAGEAAQIAAEKVAAGESVGIMFGRERNGLENDEVALADRIITLPVNPAFASLNLAQAVVDRRLRVVQADIRRRAAVPHAAKIRGRAARAVARVLRQPRTRTGEGRVLPSARQARDDADQPAQHLLAHAADAAGHPDPARRRHVDRGGAQGSGARRRARQPRGGGVARAARRAERGPGLAADRCAGSRGSCGAIRPMPSVRCGRGSTRIAVSPGLVSSARRRSARTSRISCRFGCGW